MKILVGYTGFVGSNLVKSTKFDGLYNSKNIELAYGTNPDLLVYSGIPAQKFIANQYPEKDMDIINNAIENIKKINPKKIVLISTIDVYPNPVDVDEDTIINSDINQPYGKNRYYLENWVKNTFDDYLIVRLPGLYGKNIKKNFIYDLIHIIPNMLNSQKFEELCEKDNLIMNYYQKLENGFYQLKTINNEEKLLLKQYFNNADFSALNFTDSRGVYQFYNLSYLWQHIKIAMDNQIQLLNLSTEPVLISEIYHYIIGKDFKNEIVNTIPEYNFKTKYSELFANQNGYIFDKKFVLEDIKNFVLNELGYHLSISNIGWEGIDDNDMYNYISQAGFDAIEIAPTRIISENPYDHQQEAIEFSQSLMQNYNLCISSMQSIWYGKSQNIFKSPEERNELIEYTKKAIDFAAAIGCKNLVFGCPKNRNVENKDTQDYECIAISFFKEIGQYAAEKQIIISIEPNPKIYNTNFINTTEEAFDLVKKINMESIRVNIDLGTIIQNNEGIDLLVNNINYINHIHISEPNLVKIQHRNLHEQLMKLLKKCNYHNYISIEMSNKNSVEDVKESIDYVRRIFK